MKFERLVLSDFQSYDELDIELEEGLTLIHGPNGAGKSTIARALYTTLYPLHGRNRIGAHELVDLIQDGKDSATSELVFSVGDDRYRITVDIARRSDGGARAGAEMTNLETGETYSEKSTEIEAKVTQLLGMNYEAFANSTYAQQTEVNRLIESTPAERERILDNLLGLTAPDEYAEDINEVSDPIEDWLEDKRSKLQNVRKDIERLEADDPKATLQSKAEEIEELEDRIDELSDGVEEARERRRAIDDDIKAHRESQSDLDELRNEYDETEEAIVDLEAEIDKLGDAIDESTEAIADHRDRIADLDNEVAGYDLTTAEGASKAVDQYEDEYDSANTLAEQKRASVESAQDEVSRLEGELDDLQGEFDDAESQLDAHEADVDDAEAALADAETTLEQRRDERDAELREYLETPLNAVEDYETAVRDHMNVLRSEKSDFEAARETKRSDRERLADEIDAAEAELSEAHERRETIRQSLEADVNDPEAAFEAAVARADEQASSLGFSVAAEDIDTVFTGRLPAELEAALDDHRDAADDLANAREEVGRTTVRIDDLRSLAAGEWPLDGGDIGATHDYDEHIDQLEAKLSEAQTAGTIARDELDAAGTRLERVQAVAEALFEAASFRALADAAAEIDELEAEIEEARDTRAELKRDIESQNDEIQRLATELEDGEAVIETIEAAEQAATAVEEAERDLDAAREELEAAKSEVEAVESEIEDTQAELEAARNAVDEAEAELAEAEEELAAVEAARDAAREARDAHGEIDTLESSREGDRSRRSDKRSQLETERGDLQEITAEIEELETEIGDSSLEDLQDRKQEVEELIDELEGELDTAREERDAALDTKSKAEDRLDRLHDKRARKGDLEEKAAWAQSLVNDFETITDTYARVQTRMRTEILDRLKYHTNNVFDDLYQNSTYEAVDIDENYDLRLVSGSETARDPNKASGGEWVLVTIALRAGVYRVLADQADGRDERLPPFILDEPTNHLDEAHIDQLEEAVESIRDWNVPQVFVVDRYEGLVEGADHRIHVEMDDGDGASKTDVAVPEAGGEEDADADGESAEAGGD